MHFRCFVTVLFCRVQYLCTFDGSKAREDQPKQIVSELNCCRYRIVSGLKLHTKQQLKHKTRFLMGRLTSSAVRTSAPRRKNSRTASMRLSLAAARRDVLRACKGKTATRGLLTSWSKKIPSKLLRCTNESSSKTCLSPSSSEQTTLCDDLMLEFARRLFLPTCKRIDPPCEVPTNKTRSVWKW